MRDLRMPFFQPPTGYDEIATGLTQGFLHLMGCLLARSAHTQANQTGSTVGSFCHNVGGWTACLPFGTKMTGSSRMPRWHNAVCRRTRSCRLSTLALGRTEGRNSLTIRMAWAE